MAKLKELRIRPFAGTTTTFTVEGSWDDTENKATVTIECNPSDASLARLIELVELTRKAGEGEIPQS